MICSPGLTVTSVGENARFFMLIISPLIWLWSVVPPEFDVPDDAESLLSSPQADSPTSRAVAPRVARAVRSFISRPLGGGLYPRIRVRARRGLGAQACGSWRETTRSAGRRP